MFHDLRVDELRVEYTKNPLGIDTLHPRLSWLLRSDRRGTMQSAYQIRVFSHLVEQGCAEDLIWDSGKTSSDQSTHRPYAGAPLRSRQRYYWQVRVWNERGVESPWSKISWWEMGFLSKGDWSARWIAPPIDATPTISTPAPLLRTTFQLQGKIARARVYVTSLGLYEVHLNGEKVGDALFTPGWTSFDKRLQYQTYDITEQLTDGANAVGVILGDGWYRRVSFQKNGHLNNGKPLALLLQIEVSYADGRKQTIVSDPSWKTATGPILRSEIYNGEIYDARLGRDGWATASYDDRSWSSVRPGPSVNATLFASVSPPVRRIEEITPVKVFQTSAGVLVVDMGQNVAGWVRLRVQGSAGTAITLRHAETLDRDGNLYTENLTTAEQRVQYTLRGQGEEIFEPHFTYQGFRYVTVEGYPGELGPGSLTAIVIHSDVEQTGRLETSDPLINRLHHNIVWTLRSNYFEVPTDNPQRAERLGWCLDAAVASMTGMLNMNLASFFTKWLGDLAADQLPDGSVPVEIPRARWARMALNVLYGIGGKECSDTRSVEMVGAPGYSDAATIVPWNVYLAYGDVDILRSQYQSMVRWVEYVKNDAGDGCIWKAVLNMGDWADFETTRNPCWFGSNDHDLMATAFFAHSVDILRRTAEVLGKTEDSVQYAQLLSKIQQAFCKRYVSDDGRVGKGMQADYVLALDFDLLPQSIQPVAARRLVEDVRSHGHLTTGIAGTHHLLQVLCKFGYVDEAYMLLNRREMPSWLYHIMNGATTMWERWDGIAVDGSFQNPGMNSFNQCALGAVGEWMYTVVAGIAIDTAVPGYKHILIQPCPGGGLSSVKASYLTLYGAVSTEWRIERGIFHLSVAVPPNTSATVRLPSARLDDVIESGHRLSRSNGVTKTQQAPNDAVIEVQSGQYNFSYFYNAHGGYVNDTYTRSRSA